MLYFRAFFNWWISFSWLNSTGLVSANFDCERIIVLNFEYESISTEKNIDLFEGDWRGISVATEESTENLEDQITVCLLVVFGECMSWETSTTERFRDFLAGVIKMIWENYDGNSLA